MKLNEIVSWSVAQFHTNHDDPSERSQTCSTQIYNPSIWTNFQLSGTCVGSDYAYGHINRRCGLGIEE